MYQTPLSFFLGKNVAGVCTQTPEPAETQRSGRRGRGLYSDPGNLRKLNVQEDVAGVCTQTPGTSRKLNVQEDVAGVCTQTPGTSRKLNASAIITVEPLKDSLRQVPGV